jgi:rare lipoprotein A
LAATPSHASSRGHHHSAQNHKVHAKHHAVRSHRSARQHRYAARNMRAHRHAWRYKARTHRFASRHGAHKPRWVRARHSVRYASRHHLRTHRYAYRKTPRVAQTYRSAARTTDFSGIASIYGVGSGRTANGERSNIGGLTAAHRTLPFGTRVAVTNRRNGRSVVVRINDRGPFVRGRVIDLTPAAARAIGFTGLTQVSLSVLR